MRFVTFVWLADSRVGDAELYMAFEEQTLGARHKPRSTVRKRQVAASQERRLRRHLVLKPEALRSGSW